MACKLSGVCVVGPAKKALCFKRIQSFFTTKNHHLQKCLGKKDILVSWSELTKGN